MIYVVSSEDINKLKAQINIDDKKAEELLLKHNGDIVECVLDSYNFKPEKTEPDNKFTKIRKIVNEKNLIYNNNIANNNLNNNLTNITNINMVNKNKIKVI